MLRHVDPPTVVRRHVVDRAALLSRTGAPAPGTERAAPGGRSKGLLRAEAAQARKAEARESPQPSEGRVGSMGVRWTSRPGSPGG